MRAASYIQQQHSYSFQKSLLEVSSTNSHEKPALESLASYSEFDNSCIPVTDLQQSFDPLPLVKPSAIIKECLPLLVSHFNIYQCSNSFSSYNDILKSFAVSIKIELTYRKVLVNLPCNLANAFEYFCIVLQCCGVSYLYYYQCTVCLYYYNNAQIVTGYQAIHKHADELLCIAGFYSDYHSVVVVHKRLQPVQYTDSLPYG